MITIKCPHCGEVFEEDDEAQFASIVQQVREHTLNEERKRLEAEAKAAREQAVELAKIQEREAQAQERETLAKEVTELTAQLKNQLSSAKTEQELAVQKATVALERRTVDLEHKLELEESSKRELEQRLLAQAKERELALRQSIADREEEIQRLNDMKTRLSTKMLGETLEQHCEAAFNQIRATAFRNATFEKDNKAAAQEGESGTKGDYIFRDYAPDGTEFVSIMFEMKNEADTTSTKHKNADFFKKLDDDRRKKNCEYAVLVSLLEQDSELYNQGIVDVSYEYEKMYVIRPQFFIPLITLIRDLARQTIEARRALIEVQQKNLDVTNFEDKLDDFKEKFGYNVEQASKKFDAAIAEIDKTIDHLNKVRENLQASERQLRLANDKTENLTIKRLTRGNPTMKTAFEEARSAKDAPEIEGETLD